MPGKNEWKMLHHVGTPDSVLSNAGELSMTQESLSFDFPSVGTSGQVLEMCNQE